MWTYPVLCHASQNLQKACNFIYPQVAFIVLPGKNHIIWYICSAIHPRPVWSLPVKRNNQINILFALAIICWTFTTIRIWILKRQQSKTVPTAPDPISNLKTDIEKQSLANLASIIGLNSIKFFTIQDCLNGPLKHTLPFTCFSFGFIVTYFCRHVYKTVTKLKSF